jgi:hypothetical protein
MLCAVSSKKTLLGLWADLKAASKTEFESELARAFETIAKATEDAGAPPTACPPRSRPSRSASPAARIAHRLTGELGLTEREAVSALIAGLRQKGVDAAKIPGNSGESLIAWVEALLDQVSGAVVMGAAQRIERR